MIFFCCASVISFGQSDEKPNVLWITIEDTSPHFIGSYRNKEAKTPNIDRLAEKGVRFTNAFANAPVCSAARSTIITGTLNEVLGTGNHRSNYPIPDFIKGFPTFLKNKGWYTSNNPKTDYNTSDAKRLIEESWHESSGDAGWWNRESEQPFFSVINHTESHQSRTMTNPYQWYKEFVYEKLEEDLVIGEDDFEMPPYLHDSPEMRKYFARVYNSISLTDKNIGLLLDRLERDGLIDETIIFLYADHGEAIPRGKTGSVGIGYKVPLIVWFPEKYQHLSPWGTGTVSDELVNFDDLGPTVLSLAGIKAPDYMTGRPIMGEFRKSPETFLFTSRNRIDETPGLTRSITDGNLMYSKVFTPQFPELEYQKYADVSDLVQLIRKDYKSGKLNEVQAEMLEERNTSGYLYDLDSDPWKLNNLAEDEKYVENVRKLRDALYEHILEIRDVMFLPEYTIDQLSKYTTPFEFRKSSRYNLSEILRTAKLAGQEGSALELINKLNTEDRFVLYWTLMGLQARKDVNLTMVKPRIISLMEHEYPPVQVLASIMVFNKFPDEKVAAKEYLRSFIASDNPLLALQALQLIQYTNGSARHFIKDFQELIRTKKDKSSFLSPVSVAETILFYENERPLYYRQMKKWLGSEE